MEYSSVVKKDILPFAIKCKELKKINECEKIVLGNLTYVQSKDIKLVIQKKIKQKTNHVHY